MFKSALRLSLAGPLLLTAGVPAAWAVEAEDFGDRLKDVVALVGISLAYEAARSQGADVVLSDISLIVPGEDPVELPGDVTFSNVTETPEGHYLAERATIDDIEFEPEDPDFEEVLVSIRNIAVEDIRLPADLSPEQLHIAAYTMASRASVGPITAVADGQTLLASGPSPRGATPLRPRTSWVRALKSSTCSATSACCPTRTQRKS